MLFLGEITLCSLALVYLVSAAPAPLTDSVIAVDGSSDLNPVLWGSDSDITPEPIRGSSGATSISVQNLALDLQNPDQLAPPTTDSGPVQNSKWSFSQSHNRLASGGWARQQNGESVSTLTARFNLTSCPLVGSLPIATDIAGNNFTHARIFIW